MKFTRLKIFIFLIVSIFISSVFLNYRYYRILSGKIANIENNNNNNSNLNELSQLFYKELRKEKYFDKEHVITTLENGMPIIVNTLDRMVCLSVRKHGSWSDAETKVIRSIVKSGFNVIEVGSNFGVFTLQMAELVGKTGHIYAFEANQNVSKYLTQSVSMNNLNEIVDVYSMAVSDHSYKGMMVYDKINIGGGYIFPENEETLNKCKNALCVPIQVDTLDSVIGNKKINVLKMDAEGAECWILKGAKLILKNNPDIIIMMEWFTSHMKRNAININDFVNEYKESGFKFWKITDSGLESIQPEYLLKDISADIVLSKNDISINSER